MVFTGYSSILDDHCFDLASKLFDSQWLQMGGYMPSWPSICKTHPLLWLSMPNSVLTDLVVFPFFPLSYPINIWQPHCPYASLSFHIMPHALHTSFTSVQCMAMFFFSSLPLCPRHAVASCFSSLPFHGHAWCMLRLDRVGTGVDSTDREIALRVVL